MNKINKVCNWFWGLMFLGIAGLILSGRTYIFDNVSLIRIFITVFLVYTIVKSIFRLSFFGMLIPAAILYMMYASTVWWLFPFSSWSVLWAAIFASIGLSILFRRRHYHHGGRWYEGSAGYHGFEESEDSYYE